jgi:phosphoribosylglycinamide formyltransferase 1
MSFRIVVLASGSGTNLQALLDASRAGTLSAEVAAVVTDNEKAGAIERARAAGVPALIVVKTKEESRSEYDARLAECVQHLNPDLVVLAGFMRLLSMQFLCHFPMRVINLHPALPGELPGTNAIERAFVERDTSGRHRSGVMVHFVPDEGVDNGPVIALQEVPLLPTDTLDTFADRIHAAEHQLIVTAVHNALTYLSDPTTTPRS